MDSHDYRHFIWKQVIRSPTSELPTSAFEFPRSAFPVPPIFVNSLLTNLLVWKFV